MNEHPLLLLLFTMVNLTSASAFAFVAFSVLPKATRLTRRTRVFGEVATLAAAITHIVLAMMVLFSPETTAAEMSASWPALVVHGLVAGFLWAFLIGLYIEREQEVNSRVPGASAQDGEPFR